MALHVAAARTTRDLGQIGYLFEINPGHVGPQPRAVLLISGHWQTSRPTVNVNPTLARFFDYYNFPERTYRLTYPAPGAPELAARVRDLLKRAGIASDEEHERGFDHGVFIPFMLIYPEADVPILQMSLQHNPPTETHLAIGRALAPLWDEGVLIVGSGTSYHNLREFFSTEEGPRRATAQFDGFLKDAVETADPSARESKLCNWRNAPGTIASHPTAEHLAPLFVVAGAAKDDFGRRTFADEILGKAVSGFQFG